MSMTGMTKGNKMNLNLARLSVGTERDSVFRNLEKHRVARVIKVIHGLSQHLRPHDDLRTQLKSVEIKIENLTPIS